MTETIYAATKNYKKEVEQQSVKRHISVSGILKHLGVSRSGYEAWANWVPSDRQEHKISIKEQIQQIYDKFHQIYGEPQITRELHKKGVKISIKTVGNYMREMGIRAHWVKPYTITTIHFDFHESLQNILNEKYNPEKPNAVGGSDITYIWTLEGFVYLTSIMDLFSRKIISWVLSQTLEAVHVVQGVEKAKKIRAMDQPLVFHVSERFLESTKGMINSYSKKAFPWDNACIESFHVLIKREWIYRFKIFNYNHAYKLIFEYIETFYNTDKKP